MNNRNLHMRYRRSVYRRQRIRAIFIIIGVALVLLFLLFLILGNVFWAKLEKPDTKVEETTPTDTQSGLPADRVRQISSSPISLSQDSAAIVSEIDALAANGVSAISFSMTDANGTLLYHSDIALAKGFSISANQSLSLQEVCSAADKHGMYVSASFVVGAVSESDRLARSVLLAEAAAVITEAFEQGVDDVVLVAPSLSHEQYEEAIRLAESVRTFVPSAVIGLALPNAQATAPNAEQIDNLAMNFDYLAVDLTQYGDTDPNAYAEERLSAMQFYLLRYKMRVLIPTLSDGDRTDAIVQKASDTGVTNRMLLP